MENLPYAIVALFVIMETVSLLFVRKKILAMDPTTSAGQQAQKRLPMITAMIIIFTIIFSAVLLTVLPPALTPAPTNTTDSTYE